MDVGTLLRLWSNSALLSSLVWITIALVVLYLARQRIHALLRTASYLLVRQLQRTARRLTAGAASMRQRNRSYLLALGREQAKRSLGREFNRIAIGVERDLAAFPVLYRRMSEQIARIDQDYRDSTETPPQPPQWLEAITTISRGPGREDPAIQRILEEMSVTLDRAAHQALLEYRAAHRRRHRLLARMRPYWRMVERRLSGLQASITELKRRSQRIDHAMRRFETRHAHPAGVVRKLSNATGIRFLIASAILAAAIPVALVAFQLIARPIAEITAGSDALAGIPFNDVTAAVMLITEVIAGALVLESLSVTHLLPGIAALEPQVRARLRLAAACIFLLTVLAAASLAWTRDYLINQDIAVIELLQAGRTGFPGPEFHWIPALAHSALALGFGLTLGCLAIPLESAMLSGRFVLGGMLALSLTAAAGLCRVSASLCAAIGRLLIQLYDLVIFLPLRIESACLQLWRNRTAGDAGFVARTEVKSVVEELEKRQIRR